MTLAEHRPAEAAEPAEPAALGPVEPEPAVAAAVFGDRLPLARRYAEFLAGPGVERGLIGPRERSRLWTRHLLNSAVVADALPPAAPHGAPRLRVADIGSGAGLPGIPLALVRPDLAVTLVEPMARRVAFLREAVALLGVSEADIVVRHARAEELAEQWDVVVARAVAPLARLLAMTAPLVQAGGVLLAMKGQRAAAEVEEAARSVARLSTRPAEIVTVGTGRIDDEATIVRVWVDRPGSARWGKR